VLNKRKKGINFNLTVTYFLKKDSLDYMKILRGKFKVNDNNLQLF